MKAQYIDFYVQAILVSIAFYIVALTMMKIRPRGKILVFPSFIFWVAGELWLAYKHLQGADAQEIQSIKTLLLIQSVLIFWMIFEASLWKIMTSIMLCDFVCGLPFVIATGSELQEGGKIVLKIAPDLPYLPYGAVGSFLLFLLVYILLRKQLQKYADSKVDQFLWVRVFGIIFWINLLLAIVEGWYSSIEENLLGQVTSSMFLFVFVVLLFWDYRLRKAQENYYLARQNELMQAHYEVLKEQNVQAKKFKEDIESMFQQSSFQDEIAYIQKPEEQYIDHKMVNQVFLLKAKICEEEQIDFQINAEWVEGFEEMDIVTILYNVLDNAIESCRKLAGRRYITFSMKKEGDRSLEIVCKNSRTGEEVLSKGKRTWKKNKNLHGTGMEIIKDICKKYSGEIRYEENDTEFELKIVMRGNA